MALSHEHLIQNIIKNQNLYPHQSKITMPSLLWDTLYCEVLIRGVYYGYALSMHICLKLVNWNCEPLGELFVLQAIKQMRIAIDAEVWASLVF